MYGLSAEKKKKDKMAALYEAASPTSAPAKGGEKPDGMIVEVRESISASPASGKDDKGNDIKNKLKSLKSLKNMG